MTAKTAPKRKPKKKPMPIARAAYLAGYRAGHTDALRAMPKQVFAASGDFVAPGKTITVMVQGAGGREPEATIKPSWLHRLWKKVRG